MVRIVQFLFLIALTICRGDHIVQSEPLDPLPCHHGGPCPPLPPQLVPKLHNSPKCLQTSGPHDIGATITMPHSDGGVIHHVFQYCIPCYNTSARSTCYYNSSSHSNPNSQNGTWAVNNVGDAWQHAGEPEGYAKPNPNANPNVNPNTNPNPNPNPKATT